MKKLATLAAVLAGLVWSVAASAGTITVYTDRSLYDAAIAGNPALIAHDVPLSPFVNPAALNITSSPGVNAVNVTTLGGTFYLSNQHNVAADTMDMTPGANVRAVAFDYFMGIPGVAGSITGAISVNGSVVASTTNTFGQPGTAIPFFGVISDSAIASIIFHRTAIGGLQTEQVEFIKGISFATTPVPAALPLFISALGGLGFVGWQRRKTAV